MKHTRRFLTVLCCLLFGLSGVNPVIVSAAEPTLVYDGSEKAFSYRNIEGTDLFPEFKDLMPGDTKTQGITVKGEHIKADTIIYLRAEPAEGAVLPEGIMLEVYADGQMISADSAGKAGGLSKDTKLCKFTKSGTEKIEAVLKIPVTVGNEIADQQKKIEWIFTAQEGKSGQVKPGKNEKPSDGKGKDKNKNDGDSGKDTGGANGTGSGNDNGSTVVVSGSSIPAKAAKTGDESRTIFYLRLLTVSLASFVVAMRRKNISKIER